MAAPALPLESTPAALTPDEHRVLDLLQRHTYEEVRSLTGWSRGRIYQLAVRCGARKTEHRIRERAADRKRRQAEYFQEILDTTATADVLDFLDGMPDESVQLFCTSIPYNLGKGYGGGVSADAMRAVYYHGWLMQVISEMSRCLRPGGSVFLNLGSTRDWQEQLMPLDVLVYEDLRRTGLAFQSRIVWTVPHGLTPKHRLAERYETVLVWSKGEPVFNPNAARRPQQRPGKRAFKGPNRGQLSGHPLGAWPTNVWDDIGNVGHNHPERRYGAHPAQFPVKLVKRAILLYTLPGQLVCDPFNGSGTTHVGAVETGRAFVGADLFYDDVRARRLAAAVPDAFTPLTGVTDESIAVWQAEAVSVLVEARPVAPDEEMAMVEEFC